MQVIILAAGIGSRLGDLTKNIPKCLLKIYDDISILDFQLNILEESGIDKRDVYIIAGHKADKLQYLREKGINIVYNEMYSRYNNIYSFYISKNVVKEDFIIINSDTLFHKKIFEKLYFTDNGTYFVVDNYKKLGEEEMKVLIKNDRIVKFGKDIDPKNANGEYIGVSKFSFDDSKIIFDKMDELIRSGLTHIWYENAINFVLDKIIARPVFTDGLPWIEVDTPEDYERAKMIFNKIR